jgi:hypothetical protein
MAGDGDPDAVRTTHACLSELRHFRSALGKPHTVGLAWALTRQVVRHRVQRLVEPQLGAAR